MIIRLVIGILEIKFNIYSQTILRFFFKLDINRFYQYRDVYWIDLSRLASEFFECLSKILL